MNKINEMPPSFSGKTACHKLGFFPIPLPMRLA
jgi:hypothetical protein